MHQNFLVFYEGRLQEYIKNNEIQSISNAIQAGLPEGRTLRPDAELFLTINIHQMVTLPLSEAGGPTTLTENVVDELRADTRRILQAASLSSGARKEMAASHIVWGLACVLNELNLKRWRLWDVDEPENNW